MPGNLVITPATGALVVPVPNDGEGATRAGLVAMSQPIANQVAQHEADIRTTGVPRIKSVADRAALQAVTVAGLTTGELRLVPGLGVYRYDSSEATVDDGMPWVVEPNVGSGRWIHVLAAVVTPTSLGSGAKVATVDAVSGKVIEPGANRIVAVPFAEDATTNLIASASTTAYSFNDAITLATLVGDILVIEATAQLGSLDASSGCYARLSVQDNHTSAGPQVDYAGSRGQGYGTAARTIPFSVKHVVAANGTTRVRWAVASANTNTAELRHPSTIKVTHIRP